MKKKIIKTIIDTYYSSQLEGDIDNFIHEIQSMKEQGANEVDLGGDDVTIIFYNRREETDIEFEARLQKDKQYKKERLKNLQAEIDRLKKEVE